MRGFVYEEAFERDLEAVFGSAKAADKRMRVIEWTLMREDDFGATYPVVGRTRAGIPIRVFQTISQPDAPSTAGYIAASSAVSSCGTTVANNSPCASSRTPTSSCAGIRAVQRRIYSTSNSPTL